MQSDSYVIVVPSRQRPALAETALSILPASAVVTIEEGELEAYASRIPKEKIVLHPPLRGLARIRNWIMRQFRGKYVCMVDDDLSAVISMTWKRPRRYRQPAELQRIIENGVQSLEDLDLGLYCWSRQANPLGFKAQDPFNLVTYAAGAFIVAPNRKYEFDERIMLLDDIDFSLSCLRYDRVLLVDRRWYWDFGKTFSTLGGSQGVRNAEGHRADHAYLKAKWGSAFEVVERSTGALDRGKSGPKGKSPMSGIHIAVERHSSLAAK